jgi:hypothetical protein
MTHPPERKDRRLAVLILVSLAILGVGIVAERSDLFSRLRVAIQRTAIVLPSTTAVPSSEVDSGLPIVSVHAEAKDLFDPKTGIISNKLQQGIEWERPATVSFFDKGVLRFASGVGLRVHGGGSRLSRRPQSFRLHFRRRYGASQVHPGILFDQTTEPLRRLVIHNDVRGYPRQPRWQFVNPLAYDISRRIGAITVQTRPTRFFLNGELQGVYVLSEYISSSFFEARFGHADFASHPAALDELSAWVAQQPRLTLEKVAERVDMDNLTKWFLSVLFCATRDPYQGPGQFRDNSKQMGAWFYVNWDMDGSFKPVSRRVRQPAWQFDMFEYALELRQGRRDSEVRSRLLKALLTGDQAYREYFKRMFANTLNHLLTAEFLEERFEYYKSAAESLGVEDRRYLRILRTFLGRRPSFLRRHAEAYLKTGPSVRAEIVSNGAAVTVDGFPIGDRFNGWYFPGMPVVVAVAEEDQARIAGLRVNGGPLLAAAGPLELRATQHLSVEVVRQ